VQKFDKILKDISKNVIGNEFKIKISLATILSGGHILIEDLCQVLEKQLLQKHLHMH